MTDRQWHTAAPAPPQRQQENIIPQGSTILGLNPKYQDRLVSLIRLLHKHGNPQSTARGQDSDLTLLMDYENTYGNSPETRSFAAHPERHAYKMMAALATGDDVRAWLAEWRHRGLDLGPFDKVDFFAHDALVVHQPDGMTRHLHATVAGGNRGRPRILTNGLVDPYWGTGLDPAHVSGFVAPYRSTLAPYMACCGQELGKNGEIPPGCWIPLEPGQTSGRLLRYEVWFQGIDSRAIWERVVDGTASIQFVNVIRVGTAFLDRAYYRELDRQIRALVAVVVPAIVAAQEVVLNDRFPAGASVARQLAPGIREQIHELVSLVDQYNAPQIGQCFFPTLVDDTFIDERVAFIGQGRELDAEGVLVTEKEIRSGFSLPRIRAFGQLKKVYKRLQTGPEDDKDLVEVGRVIESILVEMDDLKAIITILEDISKLVGQIQDEIQSNDVFSNVLEKKRVDEITTVFKNEANKGLPGFVDAYNQWWDIPLDVTPITQFWESYYARDRETIRDTNAFFRKTGVDVEQEYMIHYLPQVVEMLTNVRGAYLQKRPVEENDFLKKIYPQSLPLEQIPKAFEQYAHFAAARHDMANAMPALAKNLESVEQQLLERAKTARTELARRIMEEEQQEQERVRRHAELARRAAEEKEGRKNAVIVRLDVRHTEHVDISDWKIPRALTYNDQSCTYDSLFGALFAVPNQWLRDRILDAKIIPRNPECSEGNAKAIDKQIVTFIHWFENNRADDSIRRFTDVCKDRMVWTECLPTGPEEEKGQKFGSPVSLLSQLIRFYDLDFGAYDLFTQMYNQPWNPQQSKRYQSLLQPDTLVQMFAVHTETQGFGQTITYDVPLVYGEFTLLSAIIYMSGHWHACVRHPGTGIWYRLIDRGAAYQLGSDAIPKEITSPTRSDPERQAGPETGYKGSESARYEPRTWFYVRTKALAGFVSKPGSSAVQYFTYDAATTFRVSSDTDVVRLFGRRGNVRNGTHLEIYLLETLETSDDEMTLGALQILRMTDVEVDRLKKMRSGVKYAFGNWRWPATIDGFNTVIHPQLQRLVTTKKIDGRLISQEVWEEFERWAILAKFMVKSDDNQFVVPTWSSTAAFKSDPLVLAAPTDWIATRRTDEYFFGGRNRYCIARLWSLILLYLLQRLLNMSVRTTEAMIETQIEVLSRKIPALLINCHY